MTAIHKFESAGLGQAPFRLMGVVEKRGPITRPDGTQIGSPGQPMGTCAFCGTSIAECYQIRSADGKLFIVGSNCVYKTGDAGLVDTVKREANKLKTTARREKLATQAVDAKAAYIKVRPALTKLPHTNSYYASQGKTMADYWDYVLAGCGNASYVKHVNILVKQFS